MTDTPTQPLQKLTIHRWLALAVLAIGLALMAMKIYADSEPGAIPLLLVVVGISWSVVTRWRVRSQRG